MCKISDYYSIDDLTVFGKAPNLRIIKSCMSCKYCEDNSGDMFKDLHCKKYDNYFTEYDFCCDDYQLKK